MIQPLKKALAISAVFLLTACSDKTPMQWLQSDTKAEHLNSAFWTKEYEGKTPLWRDAVNYCKTQQAKVNCGAVNEVVMLQTNNTELAPKGSGHEIWEPK